MDELIAKHTEIRYASQTAIKEMVDKDMAVSNLTKRGIFSLLLTFFVLT
jgi:hypothetical protein